MERPTGRFQSKGVSSFWGVSSSSYATALTSWAVELSLPWSSPVQVSKSHQRAWFPDQPNATIIYVEEKMGFEITP